MVNISDFVGHAVCVAVSNSTVVVKAVIDSM